MKAVTRPLIAATLSATVACTAVLGATDVPDVLDASVAGDAGDRGDSGVDGAARPDSSRADGGATDADASTHPDADASPLPDAAEGSVSYTSVVLADSPLAYWKLGEPAGSTVATDATGRYPGAYHGAVTFAQPGAILSQPGDLCVLLDSTATTPGWVGVSGMFAAISQFPVRAPFSLEAWLKPTKIDTQYRGIFSNELLADGGKEGYVVYLGGFTANGTGVGYDRYESGSSTPVHDAGAVTQNTGWYHLVGVYDGSQITLYVNGQAAAQASSNLQQQTFAGCEFAIGATLCGTSGYYQGYVDEVAAYGTALSAARVQAHYLAAQ